MRSGAFRHKLEFDLADECLADIGCFQDVLEAWISEAIDLGDYERCRAICDVYWALWFADNEERKSAA